MRIEGWEARLAAVIEAARARPYVLGEHDCFRFACAAVEALTDRDLWSDWAGTYSTRRQALRQIVQYGGSFTGAMSKLFGVVPCSPRLARRGDILKFVSNDEPHLGVCTGTEVAVLAEAGLIGIPATACECCWGID